MHTRRKLLAVAASLFVMSNSAFAAENGSADEARALVKKAVAYIKTHGKDKAFAEFSDPKGAFNDRDMYIAVLDFTGKMLAHGANRKLIGKNLIELKDADAKYFVKDYLEIANSKGAGSINFKWPNPVSKDIEQKTLFFERLDDVVVSCGVYKK